MLILTIFLAACLFAVCRSLASVLAVRSKQISSSPYPPASAPTRTKKDSSVWGFVYYNTPFSLFPPNAAISLTDDNSTSFAARPAAFGPNFHPKGLSGQLWVGNGFAEDVAANSVELGCSDVPGWNGLSALRPPKPDDSTGQSISANQRGPRDSIDEREFESMSASENREPSTDSLLEDQYRRETADIRGKIVLLMRGGCGFLEKVMWAQRRGAIAVVVGDNQKGGPLIQMFAHGEEVDNVTIPSVFTARTTAQLLSSLTQPGSFIEDTIDDYGVPTLKVRRGPYRSQARKPKRTSARESRKSSFARRKGWRAWVARVFKSDEPSLPHADDIRPPSSDHQDWLPTTTSTLEDSQSTGSITKLAEDGREMIRPPADEADEDAREPGEIIVSSTKPKHSGASVSSDALRDDGATSNNVLPPPTKNQDSASGHKAPSLLAKLFGSQGEDDAEAGQYINDGDDDDADFALGDVPDFVPDMDPNPDAHEGLWITITPTSSASPFFDTLLVLVISPLVTLTVVYALLILRARIRRRRWRAPKSVIERLPVRTYRTVAPSPVLSPRIPSSPTATPTTPLLSTPSRPRPRSRTTTGVMESDMSSRNAVAAVPTNPRPSSRAGPAQPEKGAGGFSAEWKKYMGRQVECVVCLEEYVDGVSKVMGLPCGHEFHADCM